MSHVASVCTPCCMLMQVVGSCCAKVETGQTLSQQLPTFLLFSDRRRVAQQCWIQLHSSSNIVGAREVLYTRSPWSSLSFMDCVLPTMQCRSQHCWKLLHLFLAGFVLPGLISTGSSDMQIRSRNLTKACLGVIDLQ